MSTHHFALGAFKMYTVHLAYESAYGLDGITITVPARTEQDARTIAHRYAMEHKGELQ